MEKVVLEIPEEILISLKESSKEFSKDILILAAVKLTNWVNFRLEGRRSWLESQELVSSNLFHGITSLYLT